MKRESPGASGTSSLHAQFSSGADGVRVVALSGSIDENSDLQGVFARLDGAAVFNMQQVERVNSMGVHRWIPLVTKFSAEHRLMIDEISYALVQNANVVANLFGAAVVRSCMAPYYCSHCNSNTTLTVSHDEVAAAGDGPPAKYCGRCKSQMDFDELDGYFAFFKPRARR